LYLPGEGEQCMTRGILSISSSPPNKYIYKACQQWET